MQEEFDKIPKLLIALAVIYFFALGFTGLSLIASAAALGLMHTRARMIAMANLAVAALASLALLIGNLVTTIGTKTAVKKINDLGDDIGLSASAGVKFMAMSWVAFGLMVISVGYWGYQFRLSKRYGHGGFNEKYDPRHSAESYSQPRYRPQSEYGPAY